MAMLHNLSGFVMRLGVSLDQALRLPVQPQPIRLFGIPRRHQYVQVRVTENKVDVGVRLPLVRDAERVRDNLERLSPRQLQPVTAGQGRLMRQIMERLTGMAQ